MTLPTFDEARCDALRQLGRRRDSPRGHARVLSLDPMAGAGAWLGESAASASAASGTPDDIAKWGMTMEAVRNTGREGVIGLAEAIDQVRAELLKARASGEQEDLRFRLGEVTLEFAVELGREGGAEAGVKVWVVNVGAKGTVSSTRSHTVTVTMTPQILGEDGTWADARVGAGVPGRPLVPGTR